MPIAAMKHPRALIRSHSRNVHGVLKESLSMLDKVTPEEKATK
ncbi:hypothetical protein BLGI_4440 [Brevibacillus laterosporus GI-9]|nr:hypothetical protein BLGI_4440 [Brevibacillus laterosporus GI-9]